MLLFEANLIFLRRSCRELYMMNGRRRRRRTIIKWRNFGTDLSHTCIRDTPPLGLSYLIRHVQALKGIFSLVFYKAMARSFHYFCCDPF